MIHQAVALLFAVTTAAPATPAPRNACQLLTPREVARVQGEAFQSTKLTEASEHGLEISQCFYALPSFARSVSVDIMRGKALDFWRQHFPRAGDESEQERERAEKTPAQSDARKEPESEARPVPGVGDAAVWSGNRMAGALYVLRGETILRVSVGGPGTAEEKIDRSKKLAARALRRL
jgi:hypothetical protein